MVHNARDFGGAANSLFAMPSGGRDIEQIHNDFKNNRNNMIERMDKMHHNVLKGFGGDMRSLIANDPFFNAGSLIKSDFGNFDKMF